MGIGAGAALFYATAKVSAQLFGIPIGILGAIQRFIVGFAEQLVRIFILLQ